MKKLAILVVDDEKGYRDEISEYLSDGNFEVYKAAKPSEALKIINTVNIDIAIIDLKLPEMNGISLLKKMHQFDPEIAIIMISGHGDMASVIQAMREGALDFFAKPFDLIDIQYSIERTQKYMALQKQIYEIRNTYEKLLTSQDAEKRYQMIGCSDSMKQIINLMKKVAETDCTDVLITGESGTGKELVARGIHNLSSRKDYVFFDVNCTAIPENLFESEFFGHTKHAFTGADSAKKGWFEIAQNGTLFLDEIGDMPLSMQAKLLRVLEERKIRRVGSSENIPIDVRVIVSTNKNLEKLISKNLFRKDLYYRLHKFHIHIPPLKDRTDDILPLVEYYVNEFCTAMKKKACGFSNQSIQILKEYDFPGNVRELKNMIERAVIMSKDTDKYLKFDTRKDFHKPETSRDLLSQLPDLKLENLKEIEKDMICKAMRKAENNKTKAAELLGITRTSLNRKIKKYNLDY
ncbi:MAG: sigma-54 dependent transcriptional regulator [Candidatus Cloacimonetes bacterium]|nr:sigma-54 dependent transcriptional regulator [Candidatus Cloacimonadota bacterium]MCF7815137.1 sigma-54 dependent transcriptional regulator [Candidatus Cloacimonadota bacterium]MCF7869159.1 sigma-54 dependent transcriptional regulator [Candidatus Cloacimonadota bacterium]MCF7884605.1 sigma-54 dependent transcriptional regulator [Candidatus Cloacimonadota bacterium]